MKTLLKTLSFLFVFAGSFMTIFKMNKHYKQQLEKEITIFQVKQTIAALAFTLEKNKPRLEARQESQPKIKGNKNARGELIYHLPGGVFYSRTNPVEWFQTEEEALAKGYRKSAR